MTSSPLAANRSALLSDLYGARTVLQHLGLVHVAAVAGDKAKFWSSLKMAVDLGAALTLRLNLTIELLEQAAQPPVPHRPGATGRINPVQPIPEPVAANDAHQSTPEQPDPVVA